jgi:hypothetical protein
MNDLHTLPTETIKYANLEIGDLVWLHGHLFRADSIAKYEASANDNRSEEAKELYGRAFVRFIGRIVDDTDDLVRSSYNGGTYGGAELVEVRIVSRVYRSSFRPPSAETRTPGQRRAHVLALAFDRGYRGVTFATVDEYRTPGYSGAYLLGSECARGAITLEAATQELCNNMHVESSFVGTPQ